MLKPVRKCNEMCAQLGQKILRQFAILLRELSGYSAACVHHRVQTTRYYEDYARKHVQTNHTEDWTLDPDLDLGSDTARQCIAVPCMCPEPRTDLSLEGIGCCCSDYEQHHHILHVCEACRARQTHSTEVS